MAFSTGGMLLLAVSGLLYCHGVDAQFRVLVGEEAKNLTLLQSPENLEIAARTGDTVTIDITMPTMAVVVQEDVNVILNCLPWLMQNPGGSIRWLRVQLDEFGNRGNTEIFERTVTQPPPRRIVTGQFNHIVNITRTIVVLGGQDPDAGIYMCEVCTDRGGPQETCFISNTTIWGIGSPPDINDTANDSPPDFVITQPDGRQIINYRIGADFCIRQSSLRILTLECNIIDRVEQVIPGAFPTPDRTWRREEVEVYTQEDRQSAADALDMSDFFMQGSNLIFMPEVVVGANPLIANNEGSLIFEQFEPGDDLTDDAAIRMQLDALGINSGNFQRALFQQILGNWSCSANNSVGSDTAQSTIRECSCAESFSAGTIWQGSFEGDILYEPCTRLSSRFSNGVQMSRTCSPNRVWSEVDLSACTLRVAREEPVLFHWFALFAAEVPPGTDRVALLNSRAAAIIGNINTEILVPVSANVGDAQLEIDIPVTTLPSLVGVEVFPVVYSASVDAAFTPTNIDQLYQHLNSVSLQSTVPFLIITNPSDYRGSVLLQTSEFCECRPPLFQPSSNATIQQLCAGISASPCNCTVDSCQCIAPFVGNGTTCSLDADQDGFPNQALPGCTAQEISSGLPYCLTDTCPNVFNLPQSNTAPCTASVEACPLETDEVYGLQWGFAQPGETVEQPCGPELIGNASRVCGVDGEWMPPEVQDCRSRDIVLVENLVTNLLNVTLPPATTAALIQESVDILTEATGSEEVSILPGDLEATSGVLATQVSLLEGLLNETAVGDAVINETTNILDIMSNVLAPANTPAYDSLLNAGQSVGESLLDTTERYGLYIANVIGGDMTGEVQEIVIARDNVVLQALSVTVAPNDQEVADVQFPIDSTRINFTSASAAGNPPVGIIIPGGLLAERSQGGGAVPVVNIVFQNLQDFLPSDVDNSTAANPVSFILSSQVVDRRSASVVLLQNPVVCNFTVTESAESFTCVFWEFSDPVGSGGWSTVNVTTENIFTVGNEKVVQCTSTHLTSFAVLVNVAGVRITSVALNVISYIGLVISLVCLLLTIIFFLSFGKKLFTGVHNFVHLNLAIALFLAYLAFAIGVDLASENRIGCHFVAALLQYLFLTVFTWMMCEGIMLYLMLVVVFSTLSKKWWFFLLLGWLPPLIFVVIGLATVLDGYVVRDENGDLEFCWLAANDGTHAIWTFAAPMITIIIINTVFLILVLVSLFRNRSGRRLKMKDDGKRVELVTSIVKASVILLPLLGITWVLGLFAVSENTLVFAWLFTIFNSLQGLFIFIFHVLRHERIWGRFKKKYSLFKSKPDSQGMSDVCKRKTGTGVADSTAPGSSGVAMKSLHSSVADKEESAEVLSKDMEAVQEEEVETRALGKRDLTKEEEEEEGRGEVV